MPNKNFLSPEEKNYLQQALKKETGSVVKLLTKDIIRVNKS